MENVILLTYTTLLCGDGECNITNTYFVTLWRQRSRWITATRLASKSTRQFPVIAFTLVTLSTENVRQTDALTGNTITAASISTSSQNITQTCYTQNNKELQHNKNNIPNIDTIWCYARCIQYNNIPNINTIWPDTFNTKMNFFTVCRAVKHQSYGNYNLKNYTTPHNDILCVVATKGIY